MSLEPNFLDVKIMGREYRVACGPEERDALLAAVDLVDGISFSTHFRHAGTPAGKRN